MSRKDGRPSGVPDQPTYYHTIILEELSKKYPEGLRFSEFKESVSNPKTLNSNLKKLMKEKYIVNKRSPEAPRGKYYITKLGSKYLLAKNAYVEIGDYSLKQIYDEIKENLYTDITRKFIDTRTSKQIGFIVIPNEQIRKNLQKFQYDEDFLDEIHECIHASINYVIGEYLNREP